MSTRNRKGTAAVAGLLAFALGAPVPLHAAAEADYPARPIRLLVGFNPGGGADITARTVGEKLSERLGQSIIVDNRPAAGGVLARSLAAEAVPDGYTLLILSASDVISAALVQGKPVDMRKTFTAVSTATIYPYVLTTNPALPIKSLKDLIAYAKAKPGTVNYGYTGVGTEAHLASELLNYMAGIRTTHIHYKGAAPGLIALMGGEIQMLFSSALSAMPHIKAGRVRLLGSSSSRRLESLPDVPTIAESGLPGFDVTGWYGVIAPAKTPPAVITKLNRAMGEVLKMPEVHQSMARNGTQASYTTPQEFTALVEQHENKWRKLVKETGLKLQ